MLTQEQIAAEWPQYYDGSGPMSRPHILDLLAASWSDHPLLVSGERTSYELMVGLLNYWIKVNA